MRYLLMIIGLGLITSCVHRADLEMEVQLTSEEMIDWQVADGFTYEMSPKVEVQISFGSSASRTNTTETLQFALMGEISNSDFHTFHVGYARLSEGIILAVNKPLHINRLILYTKYQGNAKYFDVNSGAVTMDVVDLLVSEGFLESGSSRVSSVPDCNSFLNRATQLRCRADGVSIKSSASIQFVDILYTDGST